MPRYFFDVTNGSTLADEVGEEFELVEAARGHAIAVAGDGKMSHRNRPSMKRSTEAGSTGITDAGVSHAN
jgi:hypothetical protein